MTANNITIFTRKKLHKKCFVCNATLCEAKNIKSHQNNHAFNNLICPNKCIKIYFEHCCGFLQYGGFLNLFEIRISFLYGIKEYSPSMIITSDNGYFLIGENEIQFDSLPSKSEILYKYNEFKYLRAFI